MKIKELFEPTGITQPIGGLAVFLDRENCQIVNKTKKEDSISLHLKRISDGSEGNSYLRVQEKYESIASLLLNKIFANEGIVGLTLNQLDEFETNLKIENFRGRLKIVPKLFIFVGLPGSGKSHYLKEIENRGVVARGCIYDDYHADAPTGEVEDSLHYAALINNLKNGIDCAVADIAFCEKSRREGFVSEIKAVIPSVEITIKYFENKPDICKKNVQYASQRSAYNRIQKINEFSGKYDIPKDAEIIKVLDSSILSK